MNKHLPLPLLFCVCILVLVACKTDSDSTPQSQSSVETAPSAVSHFVASHVTPSQVTLSWIAATESSLNHFQIFKNDIALTTVDGTESSFTDETVSSGDTHHYTIIAVGSGGHTSEGSTITLTIPYVEVTLSSATPSNYVNLNWEVTGGTLTPSNYRIYRNESLLTTQSTLTFTDTSVTTGEKYSYQVVAINSVGEEIGRSGLAAHTIPPATPSAPVIAFPGAEGFGAKATGGRGGRVIKVTNLNADGPGSLQEALNQNEPRIIVFDVAGIIEADIINIPYGNVTIAGQTAPGGITIKGRLYGQYSYAVTNIIIRHIRIRPPEFDPLIHGSDANQYDAVQFSRNSNMIFDHVSVAFGADETFDLYEARDVTIQWSTIQEAQLSPHHSDPHDHNYGLINGPDGGNISLHHNLFVHNKNRNPALASGPAEVVNNVMYNVRHALHHHNPASSQFNIIGNYMKRGPSDNIFPLIFDDEAGGAALDLGYYLNDNHLDDPGEYVGNIDNPWTLPYLHHSFEWIILDESYGVLAPFDFSPISSHVPITTSSSLQAYDDVLDQVGAYPRDVIDLRDIQETRDRTGEWGARIPADLLTGILLFSPQEDSDDDGMADNWENLNGLVVGESDHNTIMPSGYTAIEQYINEMADGIDP